MYNTPFWATLESHTSSKKSKKNLGKTKLNKRNKIKTKTKTKNKNK